MRKKFLFWLAELIGVELITPIDYKVLKEKVKNFNSLIRVVREQRDFQITKCENLEKTIIEQKEQLDKIQSYLDNGTLVFEEVKESKEELKPIENENGETTSKNTPIS